MDFFKAAELDDIKEGELFFTEVDEEPVCLTKVEGVIYAFTNNCTHINGLLNEGELHGCVVTCPWHGSQFDICTGKVLRGPARQDLYTYPVKVEEDGIYISLPPAEE